MIVLATIVSVDVWYLPRTIVRIDDVGKADEHMYHLDHTPIVVAGADRTEPQPESPFAFGVQWTVVQVPAICCRIVSFHRRWLHHRLYRRRRRRRRWLDGCHGTVLVPCQSRIRRCHIYTRRMDICNPSAVDMAYPGHRRQHASNQQPDDSKKTDNGECMSDKAAYL